MRQCATGGDGVPKSITEAQKSLEKAAETGDPVLQCQAGTFHFYTATAHDGPTSPHATNAATWLRKSVEQGQKEAQFFLGLCYQGGIGVSKDLAEAYKWESLGVRGRSGKTITKQLTSEISMAELKEGTYRALKFVAHPGGIETFMVPRWVAKPFSEVPTSQTSEP